MSASADASRSSTAPTIAAPRRRTGRGRIEVERRLPPLPGADALRALATVAVVLIHVAAWPVQDHGADQRVWQSVDLMARFSVPAFVVLSGLLAGYRRDGDAPGRTWLIRRARRTLLPFAAWAPVYLVAGLLLTGQITGGGQGVVRWLSLGSGHLYYLLLVPQLYVLALVWPRGQRGAIAAAAVAMTVMAALDAVRLHGPAGGPVTQSLLRTHAYELFPFWAGYFGAGLVAGRLLARQATAPPAWPFAAAALPSAWVLLDRGLTAQQEKVGGGTGAFLRPLLIPLVLATCGAVVWGAPRLLERMRRLRRAVQELSRYSLGIYIVHPLLLDLVVGPVLHPLNDRRLPVSVAGFVLGVAAVTLAALVVTRLITRSPLAPSVGASRERERGAESLRAAA